MNRINFLLKSAFFFLIFSHYTSLSALDTPEAARIKIKDITGTLILENQPLTMTADTGPIILTINSIRGDLALNSSITIEIDNLENYLTKLQRDAKSFTLYLDGHKMTDINGMKTEKNKLNFDIRRTEKTKTEWIALLGKPMSANNGFTKQVIVSIGYNDEKPLEGIKHQLQVIKAKGFYIFLGFFVIAVGLFFWLARKTPMMRDSGPVYHPEFKSYSLGRTQMAFWFFLASLSYVFIYLITFEINSIPSSVFILMGISSLTTIGSVVVDKNKENREITDQTSIDPKKIEIDKFNLIVDQLKIILKKRKTIDPTIKTQLIDQFNESIETLKKHGLNLEWSTFSKKLKNGKTGFIDNLVEETCKFWNDILSDENGISFHRFQMIVWTLILGAVFIITIYDSLTMPVFDENLLVLMGISSGTYIGLKIPE